MSFTVIIPARYQSQRLPGKMLASLAGKPMIAHVIAKAQASAAARIIVATDNDEIKQVALRSGAEVVMTREDHQSGTSRLAEAATHCELADDHVVVNVQGDEPLIAPENINQVAALLLAQPESGCQMASLYERMPASTKIFDPHLVKVVVDSADRAMMFSRAPIPWEANVFPDDNKTVSFLKHVGLYAYRVKFLKDFVTWPTAAIAQAERLEQLTPLWRGDVIQMAEAIKAGSVGVDTASDLDEVTRKMVGAE